MPTNPANTYAVKCDICKSEIRRTSNLAESAEGGTCDTCKNDMPSETKLVSALLAAAERLRIAGHDHDADTLMRGMGRDLDLGGRFGDTVVRLARHLRTADLLLARVVEEGDDDGVLARARVNLIAKLESLAAEADLKADEADDKRNAVAFTKKAEALRERIARIKNGDARHLDEAAMLAWAERPLTRWNIIDAGATCVSIPLLVVEARDGIDALSIYAESEGYSRTDDVIAEEPEQNASLVYNLDDGRYGMVVSNYEVTAVERPASADVPLAEGTRVRALYPNAGWGEGVIVETVDEEKTQRKAYTVQHVEGHFGHFSLDQVEPVTEERFTLTEFDAETHLGGDSLAEDGTLMVFNSFDDAAGMARFMVEDPTSFPLVGINATRYEENEQTGWAAGWAERMGEGPETVVVERGDYENDSGVWNSVAWTGEEPDPEQGKPDLLAHAVRLGIDLDPEHVDEAFLALMLAEIDALPAAEVPAAIRAVNDGAAVQDRANYADEVKHLDVRSTEFLTLVEEAWYYETKGDLALVDNGDPMGVDSDLVAVVVGLAAYARENYLTVDTQQVDAQGNDLPDNLVTDTELARRVAVALVGVLYGGCTT